MGQVPTLGTPFRRKKTTIKREWRETERGAETPPTHQRHREKLLGTCRRPILSGKLSPSQLDREEHRVNRCPYTLKPSSLTHSLQIHCIGLPSLRSHASWAWAEKRDPAAGYINLNRDHLCLIKIIFKLRKWTSVYNCMLINLSSFDTKI